MSTYQTAGKKSLGFSLSSALLQDPAAFIRDMAEMFDALDPDTISEYTSHIIAQMMETVSPLLCACC